MFIWGVLIRGKTADLNTAASIYCRVTTLEPDLARTLMQEEEEGRVNEEQENSVMAPAIARRR